MSAFSRPPFGAAGGSSSWADDDDLDLEPIPIPAPLDKVEEKEHAVEEREEPRHEEPSRRERDDRHERDYPRHERGGYEDRGGRGDRRAPRGGYEGERQKTPVPDHPPFKIYVGNLPFRMNEDDLADFLGNVSSIVDIRFPRDYATDRPKGYAYVEFHDREALVQALELDGTDIGGRAVKIDVSVDKERKPRQKENSFFEKRGDRPRRNEGPSPRDEPRERPRLTLLPRNTSTDEPGSKPTKASIFGDAKPRDEAAFLERKRREEEAKKLEQQTKKAETPSKKFERGPRKNSHDDVAGGRGGRGRGERVERAGGRGRGPASTERTPTKKDSAKPKTTEPVAPKATKIAPPASTKTKNVFELLNDSDSD
ncbi:hypothetical protein Poli38472_006710 [Pythium oligandrum]|uniref:RRM domain-containing protein n=1 Tax=Pythium oligandrum TaxID=41045 RepID=A0A8K1FAY4_PYTOL|nr:hypothetical protein Poli38472_006710 [Pythium oligandrum]|eukprot:TMW56700.1 hypothetical protein Poli38472_006710 [Pythium oligandrum]